MYSHSDRNVIRRQERQYLEADSTSFASSGRNARDRGHNVSAWLQNRVDARLVQHT